MKAPCTVIENGELYTPTPQGQRTLWLGEERIVHIGPFDIQHLRALPIDLTVIDATDCWVLPGFIDPHNHLIGAAGEQGFASRQPEVSLADLLQAGITTVVGCLGTDTSTRSLRDLLGKVRQLDAQGLTAFLYTGGFPVPPVSLTGSVQDDVVLIDKIIGLGELALADVRSSHPTLNELARLISTVRVAGNLAGKAGTTHCHIGPGREQLSLLHAVLDRYEVEPAAVHPTHINRTPALIQDAVTLAHRGCFVDFDTVDNNVGKSLALYLQHGGNRDRFTVSSDAHTKNSQCHQLYDQWASCVRDYDLPLEMVLAGFTQNTATVLRLPHKGVLRQGADADVLVVAKKDFSLKHVFARGKHKVKEGCMLIDNTEPVS